MQLSDLVGKTPSEFTIPELMFRISLIFKMNKRKKDKSNKSRRTDDFKVKLSPKQRKALAKKLEE